MSEVTESQFYMWWAIFSLAHVDNFVSPEEVRMMSEILEDVPFSEEQRSVLEGDIKDSQDAREMFLKITEHDDRQDFFKFANDMVWVDGDFGVEEQEIMTKLQQEHIRMTDVDTLVGKVEIQFEEDQRLPEDQRKFGHKAKKAIFSFRERFLDGIFGD